MNADTYDRWIAGIVPVRITEKELVLGVSNDMFCDWLSNHYKDVILETLQKTSGLTRRLVFESGHEKPRETVSAAAALDEEVAVSEEASAEECSSEEKTSEETVSELSPASEAPSAEEGSSEES